MIVLYVLGALIALVLIAALFVSKRMDYEKSVLINASIDKVWQKTNTLAKMDKWSPWDEKDPNIKKETSGVDGTPGAKQSWKSEVKNVGEGSQTIITVKEPNLLETKLEFVKPFKSVADAYVKLSDTNGKTTVTWGFKSTMPYPMNLMKFFMNFEKSMDGDFGYGLNTLKAICEK